MDGRGRNLRSLGSGLILLALAGLGCSDFKRLGRARQRAVFPQPALAVSAPTAEPTAAATASADKPVAAASEVVAASYSAPPHSAVPLAGAGQAPVPAIAPAQLPAPTQQPRLDAQPQTAQPQTAPAESVAASPPAAPGSPLQLDEVIESVYRSYPLLEAALYSRDIAAGENLAAQGAFDLKLKGASQNGPLGFYQTYRQSIGFEQPTFWGGSVFGGYRIGRGSFQPWYLERQTNLGGEFSAGFAVPLARNITIDERRAQLWRTRVGQRLAEPEIRLQRIDFVRAASYAYWDWVASGRRYQINASLLAMAKERNEAVSRKVQSGDTEPPVLEDNRRLIVSREAKLIESRRKQQESAIKLSLFYRDELGEPLLAKELQLPSFPVPRPPDEKALPADVQAALNSRPELLSINLMLRQLQIDLAEARNELLPDVQGVMMGSQDVGDPATAKNDKSRYELEAGLLLDVPVQRRKARGKIVAIEGKQAQLVAKQQMAADKITAEVQAVYTTLVAAYAQIDRARESVLLADRLAAIERRKFELGESDLLSVNLREQQAADAQSLEVDALWEYHTALADYRAVLARD